METKVCKVCGRELPEAKFRIGRGGVRCGVCNSCAHDKRVQNRLERAKIGGVGSGPISDPDFDGKTIGDVWRLMCRAQKWLESRGCVITLDGKYVEVKERKLKKE